MTPGSRNPDRRLWLALFLAATLAGCAGATSARNTAATATALAEAGSAPGDADPEARAQRQALTEEAVADLDRAGAFLAAQQRFSFRADLSYDVMQPDGVMLEFGGARVFTVRRPDRLRIESTQRSGGEKTLTFDGKAISIDLPDHRAYVSIDRPGTLYAAIDHLVDELGIPAPLEDLLGENFTAKVRPRIESGYFVQSVQLGDRRCEHLIYRLPEVDVQLWIEEGDRPLLCRISIRHLGEPGRPQFRAWIRDWKLGADVSDARFSFEPAAGTKRLPVHEVELGEGEGR